ncbi:MAG TPA: hypothetical protein PLX38_10545 [Gammaproteobacteria bacterium]|nr:hypothetical protein [Xanthomonadales bacterium]HPI96646.1 hypothetical protein [Gammaproteobacteria bacterium]
MYSNGLQELIDSISWDKLEDSYGPAINAPQGFIDLFSDNQDTREDAVYEFLLSSALHQYSTYSCTPYVVKCVLYISEYEDIKNLVVINCPLVRELFLFINGCLHSAQTMVELKKEIVKGKLLYEKYINHNDKLTSKYARMLFDFSSSLD